MAAAPSGVVAVTTTNQMTAATLTRQVTRLRVENVVAGGASRLPRTEAAFADVRRGGRDPTDDHRDRDRWKDTDAVVPDEHVPLVEDEERERADEPPEAR
jgi:hypothetical protein